MPQKVHKIMSHDCAITQRLKRRQKTMFRKAESEHGFTHKEIHFSTGMSLSAIGQYARGETAMSGPAMLKLADWKEFPAALLSILFSGTDRIVCDEGDGGDHTEYAAHCIDFTAHYAAARHPESEAGSDIGPNEHRVLSSKRRAA